MAARTGPTRAAGRAGAGSCAGPERGESAHHAPAAARRRVAEEDVAELEGVGVRDGPVEGESVRVEAGQVSFAMGRDGSRDGGDLDRLVVIHHRLQRAGSGSVVSCRRDEVLVRAVRVAERPSRVGGGRDGAGHDAVDGVGKEALRREARARRRLRGGAGRLRLGADLDAAAPAHGAVGDPAARAAAASETLMEKPSLFMLVKSATASVVPAAAVSRWMQASERKMSVTSSLAVASWRPTTPTHSCELEAAAPNMRRACALAEIGRLAPAVTGLIDRKKTSSGSNARPLIVWSPVAVSSSNVPTAASEKSPPIATQWIEPAKPACTIVKFRVKPSAPNAEMSTRSSEVAPQ